MYNIQEIPTNVFPACLHHGTITYLYGNTQLYSSTLFNTAMIYIKIKNQKCFFFHTDATLFYLFFGSPKEPFSK